MKVLSTLQGYPNYVIVTADEYYNNSKLKEFINWKRSQGYIVEVKNISEILKDYPISSPNVVFLKVQNFTDIQSNYKRVYALWFNSKTKLYEISAYHSIFVDPNTGKRAFKVVNPPSEPEYVYLYIEDKGSGNISLVFDGGKSLIVNVPNYPEGYTYWGRPLVTVDGKIFFNKTSAYSVLEYLKTIPSLEYVLLIGNVSRVPSFDLRYVDIPTETVYTSVTDHPYSVVEPESNYYMTAKVAVGRIPCDNSRELEIALEKAMRFKPFMSRKALFAKGNPLNVPQSEWDEIYTKFRDYVNQTLIYYYSGIYNYEIVEPSKQELIDSLNSENFYFLPFAHGCPTGFYFSSNGYFEVSDVYSYVRFSNSTVVTAISCLVNDYSRLYVSKCIGEALLFDEDSNTAIFLGSTIPLESGSAKDFLRCFYHYLSSEITIGKTMAIAKSVWFTIDPYLIMQRLQWNILGEPSLLLYTAPPPPPVEYGWLDLGYTIDGKTPSVEAEFKVLFPNGTVKTYKFIRGTIYNCPVGTYVVNCTHNSLVQTSKVEVKKDEGTTVIFNFHGTVTLRVYSNVEVSVYVTGPICTVKVTPFVLSGIPSGTYNLTAKYGDVTLTKIIVLSDGDDVSYTFEFPKSEISTISLLDSFMQYSPYALICLAVFVAVFPSRV